MQEFQDPKKTTSSPGSRFRSPRSGGTELIEKEYEFIGKTIADRYLVEKQLGSGGMGVVYRAQDTSLQRKVALKILRKDLLDSAAGMQRFRREGETLARLDHENIVKVHEFGIHDKLYPFIAMEYASGRPLAYHLKKQEKLTIPRTMDIAIQLCNALDVAHHNGVVHRDLSPSNIIIVENEWGKETVKIVDFGIAKIATESQLKLTGGDEIVGSPLYMSPEQCAGSNVDRRSDLYALGCILYECLTAVTPFTADSVLAVMMKHQQETPLTLEQAAIKGDYPNQLELIVARLLEKSPERRYQYADEVKKDIETFCASEVYEAICKGWSRDLWPASSVTPVRRTERNKSASASLAADLQQERDKLHTEINGLLGERTAFKLATTFFVTSFVLCFVFGNDLKHLANVSNDEGSAAQKAVLSPRRFPPRIHYPNLSSAIGGARGTSLDAQGCILGTDGTDIKRTNRFTEIDLSDSNVSDKDLAHLSAPLRNLRLTYCSDVHGAGLSRLSNIKSLRSLDLTGAHFIADEDLNLKGNLHSLALNTTAVTDKGIDRIVRQLPNLRRLELRNLQITDDALQRLKPLRLEYLDITDCQNLTEAGIDSFLKTHPDCVVKRLHLTEDSD